MKPLKRHDHKMLFLILIKAEFQKVKKRKPVILVAGFLFKYLLNSLDNLLYKNMCGIVAD